MQTSRGKIDSKENIDHIKLDMLVRWLATTKIHKPDRWYSWESVSGAKAFKMEGEAIVFTKKKVIDKIDKLWPELDIKSELPKVAAPKQEVDKK